MSAYEFDKVYEMNVIGFRRDNADRKFILVEHDGQEFPIYDIFKCQHDDGLPEKLMVTVKSMGIGDAVRFQQDKENFNRLHYKVGEQKSFVVVNRNIDPNTQNTYYDIEDELTRHRYYSVQQFNIGDTVNLEISGFKKKGYLQLNPVNQPLKIPISKRVYIPEQNTSNASSRYEYLNVGDENETLEFKSSIVYHPSKPGVPCIAKQMKVILKEIAGFMNHEGGKLYIGVRDSDFAVTGIENDYPHLNEDSSDSNNAPYKADRDGYENKIRNDISRSSDQSSTMQRLIKIEFARAGVHEYCIITVQKSDRAIWLNGQNLYVRNGNSVRLITSGDEINQFVCERMLSSLKQPSIDMDKLVTEIKTIINQPIMKPIDTTPRPEPPKAPEKANDTQYWLIWRDDATCLYLTENEHNRWIENGKDLAESENLHAIPVSETVSKNSKALIVFCYEEGFVNIMPLKEFKSGAHSGNVIKNAYNTEQKIKRIFVTEPNALLAGFSIDCHGLETIKVHNIIDLPSTQAAKNKGSLFSPSGKVYEYKLLPGSAENAVSHLKVAPAQRTSSAGIPLTSEVYQTEIEFVCKY